tara:strand:+ start:2391 stop:3098 length:708 start_codon:yes stop_codon:yes gene_type:complete
MALPKLSVPQYKVKLPSTGEQLNMRPYLVKEEKILLIALESKDAMQIQNAVKNLIMSCYDLKDAKQLTSFDLEYLFLQLRAKSVGENIALRMKCEECDNLNDYSVNIDAVKIDNIDKENTFMLDEDKKVGLTMRYPTMENLEKLDLSKLDSVEGLMDLISVCVKTIFDEDNVYNADEETREDLMDFIESFSSSQFAKIQEFFVSIPSMTYNDEIECTACGHKNKVELRGLQSFFT